MPDWHVGFLRQQEGVIKPMPGWLPREPVPVHGACWTLTGLSSVTGLPQGWTSWSCSCFFQMMLFCWLPPFVVGYSGSVFTFPPGIWCCCALLAYLVVTFGLGFCFMFRLTAISTGSWCFLKDSFFWIILTVFACVLVWTGTSLRI